MLSMHEMDEQVVGDSFNTCVTFVKNWAVTLQYTYTYISNRVHKISTMHDLFIIF